MKPTQRQGVLLAIMAVIIWSGNFIIARGVNDKVGPVSLNFYRWLTASIFLVPFAWKSVRDDLPVIAKHKLYFAFLSLTGIALFNTLVYLAGHYTSAINLALIGTTSSPVFANILAAIFLREKITPFRVLGMICCIAGIVLLISHGSIERLRAFSFDRGDWWVLLAGFFFAFYNTLVKRKPDGVSQTSFLAVSFTVGSLILLPGFLIEGSTHEPVTWTLQLAGIIAYLGIGASLIAYFFWNRAIASLGSARTALFGNLIPLFSAFEAMIILNEKLAWIHVYSGALIITGLIIANLKKANEVNLSVKPS